MHYFGLTFRQLEGHWRQCYPLKVAWKSQLNVLRATVESIFAEGEQVTPIQSCRTLESHKRKWSLRCQSLIEQANWLLWTAAPVLVNLLSSYCPLLDYRNCNFRRASWWVQFNPKKEQYIRATCYLWFVFIPEGRILHRPPRDPLLVCRTLAYGDTRWAADVFSQQQLKRTCQDENVETTSADLFLMVPALGVMSIPS